MCEKEMSSGGLAGQDEDVITSFQLLLIKPYHLGVPLVTLTPEIAASLLPVPYKSNDIV